MIFDSACEQGQRISPVPGLQEAMEMLQYLAGRGNTYAMQRFQEVQSVWNHLSTILQVPRALVTTPRSQDNPRHNVGGQFGGSETNQENLTGHEHLHSRSASGQLRGAHEIGSTHFEAGVPIAEYQSAPWDTDMWNSISDIWLPPVDGAAGENANVGNFVTDPLVEDYYNHYQSLLNDPDWALTGQDVGDFAELRRHVLRLN